MTNDIIDFVYDWIDTYSYGDEKEYGYMTPETLKKFKDKLLKFEVFKNVKTLNIINDPVVTMYQGNPIECIENYLGGASEYETTVSFSFSKGDNFKFNEVVDLYMIHISPKIYDLKETDKPEVWRKSIDWTQNTALNQIVINWIPTDIESNTSDKVKNVNKKILDEVEKILISNEANIPYLKNNIMFRGKKRSFISQEVKI